MGGHAGQMHTSRVHFDEEQHIESSQPDRVRSEEVTGHDSAGLPAQERPPGGGYPPWRWIHSLAAQRGADRGRGDAHAKPLELALIRW